MPVSRKALCIVYAAIALAALIGTWSHNLAYMDRGFVGANLAFWQDTLANPATRSITVDLFFLGIAVSIWMILEARRLGMRGAWLYLLFGIVIAISVTVPIFLINRERALAARSPDTPAGTLTIADISGLAALTAGIVAYTLLTLASASS